MAKRMVARRMRNCSVHICRMEVKCYFPHRKATVTTRSLSPYVFTSRRERAMEKTRKKEIRVYVVRFSNLNVAYDRDVIEETKKT